MRVLGKFLVGAALAAVSAGAANAQVTYTTVGTFSSPFLGCNGTAVCTGGGFTLTYTPSGAVNVGDGSVVNLGRFDLSGVGNVPAVPPGAITFTLTINQTAPTGGTDSFVGTFAGGVVTVPFATDNTSTLEWDVPVGGRIATISPVTYQLITDAVGYAAGQGIAIGINAPRSIEAIVNINSVPEPSTWALMGSGLLGVVGFARRRRSA